MGRSNSCTCGRTGAKCTLQYLLAWTVLLLTASSFFHFHGISGGFKADSSSSGSWYYGGAGNSLASLSQSVETEVETLQVRLGQAMEEIQIRLAAEEVKILNVALHQLRSERHKSSSLLVDIAATLDHVNSYLQHSRTSRPGFNSYLALQPRTPWNTNVVTATSGGPELERGKTVAAVVMEDEIEEGEWEKDLKDTGPLVQFFVVEEIRKYIRPKNNRLGKTNFMAADATYASIGHACASQKVELEKYMDYEVGEQCPDNWMLGQKLMVHGCDPLPRRRCFARGPKTYQNPLPINTSLWAIPDDRNVRWDSYICKSFKCLGGAERKGFFKCNECFDLERHERPKWLEVAPLSTSVDFLIEEVLRFKPGGIRIGLDFSVGVGTFAARMREHNITIASATLNLGAPFNEFIALRGLLPLYLSVNQRLPFFDNTLDIVHSSVFLDGWIDHQLLDFVLFDWDRVIRPGGLLWIDRFFCRMIDLDDYLYYFEQLRYKRLKWVVAPKSDRDDHEVWFSALLEKPPRPF